MIRFLDLFAYWSGVVGAAAFLIVWVIAAAHSISREEAPIGQVLYFKRWLGLMVIGIVAAVTTGQLVKLYACDEINTLVNNGAVKQVVIYNQKCKVTKGREFIPVLTKSEKYWPNGSRFIWQKYKVAIITNDTIASFNLIQNDTDSTLYRINYLKYYSTAGNGIGVIRIMPPTLPHCK